MTRYGQQTDGPEQRYLLGFPPAPDAPQHPPTLLELVYRPDHTIQAGTADNPAGYWKIGITLPQVDLAYQQLLTAGVAVTPPTQFQEIGYLCHLQDPDGHTIELLQHHFAANHQPQPADPQYTLQSRPTLGQITLRVKDIEATLNFYRDQLGMKLLSRQVVDVPYRFTLYFLAYTDESPPHEDIDAVENREWLWQRPYTTLELQYKWSTEKRSDFRYNTSPETGFEGVHFTVPQNSTDLNRLTSPAEITDPDHYNISYTFAP